MKPYYLVICLATERDLDRWMYANTWDTMLEAEDSVMKHLVNHGARCRVLLAYEPDPTDRASRIGDAKILARIEGGANGSNFYQVINEWTPKDVHP